MMPKRMANRDFCILFKSQISNCLPSFKVAYVTRCCVGTGDPKRLPVASESRPLDVETCLQIGYFGSATPPDAGPQSAASRSCHCYVGL